MLMGLLKLVLEFMIFILPVFEFGKYVGANGWRSLFD